MTNPAVSDIEDQNNPPSGSIRVWDGRESKWVLPHPKNRFKIPIGQYVTIPLAFRDSERHAFGSVVVEDHTLAAVAFTAEHNVLISSGTKEGVTSVFYRDLRGVVSLDIEIVPHDAERGGAVQTDPQAEVSFDVARAVWGGEGP